MENRDRHIDVWNNCLRIIEQIIDPQKFNTWFRPIKPVSMVDSTLSVEVPSDFFREYLEDAFLDIIKKTLKRVIGADARLVYQVRPVSVEPAMKFPAATVGTPVNKTVAVSTYNPAANPSAMVFPGVQKVQINPRLNPAYCFANLVEGECNKLGISAGFNISRAPGKNSFNPLFIFAGPGLGKTHLLQAIGIEVKERFPDLVVLYVTGNEFQTQYVDAVMGNKLTDFMAYYMRIDVLLVDDIHEMQGRASQNAFFNVFNHLHHSGKQLVFTSDRAPVELQNFEERLLSRFKWGLSVELHKPEYETRLEMLRARCFREGVEIREEVLEFLASRIKTNFRELEGALISLIAHATLIRKDIDLSLAEGITEKIVGQEQSELTIDRIEKTVCDYFNITKDALLSTSRKRNIVQARQIAMYLSRNHIAGCSLSTIGAELGGKDHATVLHACMTVSDLMSTSRTFKQYVVEIEKMLVS
ncbi:MAG: chromosomal replication initiator protein DnaA [Bacteroidales bacterium]|nr:chromosomal replication initiator protein DnaA [Bacteroidales bacterium]